MAQFAVFGLAALLIVGLATASAARRIGQREAITDARTTTLVEAQDLVEPAVTDGLALGDPTAISRIGGVIEDQLVSPSLVRVKIWTAGGRIVYSNDHSLEGATFILGSDEIDALHNGLIKADVSDLSAPENRQERVFGKLLEVYLPIRSPNGTRLLFEAYYRYNAVSASGTRIWRSFAPIALGALVVLELLQIPVAWSLARRLRQRQMERESLLQRAIQASDIERRRVANDLHDGVVQELAGVALSLAAAARDQQMPAGPAHVLDGAATSVRSAITSLRGSLVDIWSPDLAHEPLHQMLAELARDASGDALVVRSELAAMPDQLPDPIATVLYRVAREALRNVRIHAGASEAIVRAGTHGASVWVEVVDNGIGFDPRILDERAAEGHLGVKGMAGVIRDAGGWLHAETAPGKGTHVRAEVRLP